MGIALNELPAIGGLDTRERRELARWLRTPLPRGTSLERQALEHALAQSPFAGQASIERLVQVGWLQLDQGRYNADAYARRLAAGAVDGSRLSVPQAHALARTVMRRIQVLDGQLGGVRIHSALLYGSAVRSHGNLRDDVGDLDIALELEVQDAQLLRDVQTLPDAARWRALIERSGWAQQLMQGEDRITLAGSAARVLQLFWEQLHGRQLMADGRMPALVPLWCSPQSMGSVVNALPAQAPEQALDETAPLTPWGQAVLGHLQERSLAQNERARQLAQALAD